MKHEENPSLTRRKEKEDKWKNSIRSTAVSTCAECKLGSSPTGLDNTLPYGAPTSDHDKPRLPKSNDNPQNDLRHSRHEPDDMDAPCLDIERWMLFAYD